MPRVRHTFNSSFNRKHRAIDQETLRQYWRMRRWYIQPTQALWTQIHSVSYYKYHQSMVLQLWSSRRLFHRYKDYSQTLRSHVDTMLIWASIQVTHWNVTNTLLSLTICINDLEYEFMYVVLETESLISSWKSYYTELGLVSEVHALSKQYMLISERYFRIASLYIFLNEHM